MNRISFTPSSMKSPLASIGMFRKTKLKDWAFIGVRARRSSLVRDEGLDISQFINKVDNEKLVKIKFQPKTGIYLFPNGRMITGKGRFSEVKIAARTMGYTHLKLGGLKPVQL